MHRVGAVVRPSLADDPSLVRRYQHEIAVLKRQLQEAKVSALSGGGSGGVSDEAMAGPCSLRREAETVVFVDVAQ